LGVSAAEVITNFKVVQGTILGQTPYLRPHRIEIAIFDYNKHHEKALALRKILPFDVQPKEDTKVPELENTHVPAFIFLNYGDHAYAKILLDAKSIEFVLHHIELFEDTLLRQQIWLALYAMVRDTKMMSTKYLQLVLNKIFFESDIKLIHVILQRAIIVLYNFIPEDMIIDWANKLFNYCWHLLFPNVTSDDEYWWKDDSDARIEWTSTLITTARSKENVERLITLLDGKVEGFPLEQNFRWSIMRNVVAFGITGYEQRVEAEIKRDASDRGHKLQATLKTLVPSITVKEASWQNYKNRKNQKTLTGELVNTHIVFADMAGFWHFTQMEMLTPFIERFFDDLLYVFKNEEKEYAQAYCVRLFPEFPENDLVIKKTVDLIIKLETGTALEQLENQVLLRNLKETRDDLILQRKCRDLVKHAGEH